MRCFEVLSNFMLCLFAHFVRLHLSVGSINLLLEEFLFDRALVNGESEFSNKNTSEDYTTFQDEKHGYDFYVCAGTHFIPSQGHKSVIETSDVPAHPIILLVIESVDFTISCLYEVKWGDPDSITIHQVVPKTANYMHDKS